MLVVMVVLMRKHMKTTTNVYIINLAVADILMCLGRWPEGNEVMFVSKTISESHKLSAMLILQDVTLLSSLLLFSTYLILILYPLQSPQN